MEFTELSVTRNRIRQPNRCPFCGGPYFPKSYGVACLMCDRTPDVLYELRVFKEQTTKRHHNWHSTGYDLRPREKVMAPKFQKIGMNHPPMRARG